MATVLSIVLIIAALFMIVTVLLQSSEEGGISAISGQSSNSYFTSDFVMSSNKFTVDQTFEGSSADLFKDPENGDFTLKVSSVTAGDPRWIPEE